MDTQPLKISDDALKLLVAEHGVRGTARMLGMDETQMNTFRKRVTRAGWMQEPDIAALRAKSSPTTVAAPIVSKMSPTAAVVAEIQALGAQTRHGHARAAAAIAAHVAGRDAEENLIDMQNVKAAAQHADLVYGWKDAAPQVKIRLDVLSSSSDAPIVDVAAEVSDSWEGDCSDNLDDY